VTRDRPSEYLISLTRELTQLPNEAEWVEFKLNNDDPREIGEYISALSNSAALLGKPSAYVIWGIDDATHEIVGTTFRPKASRIGNEELENWLLRLLEPKIDFRFFEVEVDGKHVVLLEIDRAFRHPVRFSGQEFIRVGSYRKNLSQFSEKERELWRALDRAPFEAGIAAENLQTDEVLELLDYPSYFELMKRPMPQVATGMLAALEADELVHTNDAGLWDISNVGALLFARRLEDFPRLRRKAVRVIQYKADSRLDTIKEQEGGKGYASGFAGLIDYVNGLLPANEVIENALRTTVRMYPELAVRELIANALIHQDLFVTGAGPMVEIFNDRMEITNPGVPLVAPERFLDTPPKSRNEVLAALMRRMGICEERGSGVDKVVSQTELFQLPAPIFEVVGESTRSVLFGHRPLAEMSKEDRVRACYLHACLKYVNRDFLTNTSVRERFGIEPRNIAAASRLIKEAVDAGAIVPFDPGAAPKLMKYIPSWAQNGPSRTPVT
jgi:predicted HTH transcriptional regulator